MLKDLMHAIFNEDVEEDDEEEVVEEPAKQEEVTPEPVVAEPQVQEEEVVKAEPAGHVKEWKINGEAVTMGVEKKGE